MQVTWVWSLVWKDSTCRGARGQLSPCTTTTEPTGSDYWGSHSSEKPRQWDAHAPQLESSFHLPQTERACTKQWRPSTATNTYTFKKKTTLNSAPTMCQALSEMLRRQIQQAWSCSLIPWDNGGLREDCASGSPEGAWKRKSGERQLTLWVQGRLPGGGGTCKVCDLRPPGWSSWNQTLHTGNERDGNKVVTTPLAEALDYSFIKWSWFFKLDFN